MVAEGTSIEWADSTFNPWLGCTKVSIEAQGGGGCDYCYAEKETPVRVLRGKGLETWGPGALRQRTSADYWGQPLRWNKHPFSECAACGWRGDQRDALQLCENVADILENAAGLLETPLRCPRCLDVGHLRPARRRVFCASLADVFDNEVDPSWRADLFGLIHATPSLDWLLLTKRIGNAAKMIGDATESLYDSLPDSHPAYAQRPWTNVWLGATVVNQFEADRDIPKLLVAPAAKRFLSIEPMLGPIDLTNVAPPYVEGREWHGLDALTPHNRTLRGVLDWVIAGGESGPHARPTHPDWFRSLRDQCAAAKVPFLFKQWGEWAPHRSRPGADLGGQMRRGTAQLLHAPGNPEGFFRRGDAFVVRVGKKAAGRLLDGVDHIAFPHTPGLSNIAKILSCSLCMLIYPHDDLHPHPHPRAGSRRPYCVGAR